MASQQVKKISKMDDRCFNNPFLTESFCLEDQNEEEFLQNAQKCKDNLLQKVLQAVEDPNEVGGDASVYTGKSGIAFMLLTVDPENKLGRKEWALSTLEKAKAKLGEKERVTFLCGQAGPLAILAAEYIKDLNWRSKAINSTKTLLRLCPKVLDLKSDLPNELLYGRVGYLYSLLYVKSKCPDLGGDIAQNLNKAIRDVAAAVIAVGVDGSKASGSSSPLMYEWHGKQYFGAAHGLVGILHTLLLAKEWLKPDEMTSLVKPSIDYLVKKRFRSGNLPSSRGSENDKLIHWCHGAPGAVHLFLLAHSTFGLPIYFEAAKACGDVIWKRGVLQKGYGLCHGTAGNAYAFLALYKSTNDEEYLWRARCFAKFMFDYGQHGCREADRPYSLFEGMAGTIWFLHDVALRPLEARFPCYHL